jgi:hypothetical protein
VAGAEPQQLNLEDLRLEPDRQRSSEGRRRRHDAAELVRQPDALLTRSHLRELGLERRAIDAVFRALPVVALPGYSRPMIYAEDYLKFIASNTYRDDRVRPIGSRAHG